MNKSATYSYDKNLLEQFNKICDEKCVVKSKVVEKLIKEYIAKETKKSTK